MADENSLAVKIGVQNVQSATVTNMEVNGQSCNPFGTNFDFNGDYIGCLLPLEEGDKFTAKFTINYLANTGLTHTKTGEVSGEVEELRKAKILVIEEQSGYPYWSNQLTSLGYVVVKDTTVTTKTQVDSYNVDILACFNTFWGCAKTNLYKELYDSGYSIITEGNDNYNVLYPIISHVSTNANVPTIYPNTIVNHALTTGWTSAGGNDEDGRYGITGIRTGAYSIVKDTTNNYIEGIFIKENGKGKWYHHQSWQVPPDQLLKNIVSILSLN